MTRERRSWRRSWRLTETFPASFDSLYARRNADNIGELINEVLEAIETANDPKLKGVFRNIDFNSETNLGQAKDRNRRLKTLLEDFSKLELGDVGEDGSMTKMFRIASATRSTISFSMRYGSKVARL